MAWTGNLRVVFLLMASTCMSTVCSEEKDYIFGKDEDELLMPVVILLLVFGVILLVVGIALPCLFLRRQSKREAPLYHTDAPATTRMASYKSYYSKEPEEGDGNYESLGDPANGGHYEGLKINGVVYDNPAVVEDENTKGNGKKAEDSPSSHEKGQMDTKENEKELASFNNPAYESMNDGNDQDNEYEVVVSPPPIKASTRGDSAL